MKHKKLCDKSCTACKGGGAPLGNQEIKDFMNELQKDWKVITNHHLEREYRFADFGKALAFTNKIGQLAEREGHHPDIQLSFGKVGLKLWTHKINGLTESDFVLASKIDHMQ